MMQKITIVYKNLKKNIYYLKKYENNYTKSNPILNTILAGMIISPNFAHNIIRIRNGNMSYNHHKQCTRFNYCETNFENNSYDDSELQFECDI